MDTMELRAGYSFGQSLIEITVDTTNIQGLGSLYVPTLYIPFQYRCYHLRRSDQNAPQDFLLPEIRGFLGIQEEQRLAEIRGEPSFMIESDDSGRASQGCFHVPLDSKRIELMEKYRPGDMGLRLQLWGTAFNKAGGTFAGRFSCNNPMDLRVPQSIWVGNVLSRWKFAQMHLIEVQTGAPGVEIISPKVIEHLKTAESHFLRHNPRETMASLYSAFEALALQRGKPGPGNDFFEDLLSSFPDDMRTKYRDLFRSYCLTLHLGRHESGQEDTQQPPIQQRDARLALILGQAILAHISQLGQMPTHA